VIEQTWPEIRSVFLYNIAGELVSFFISMTRFVLFESLLWRLAGHPHIQAFQHPIELRIGFPELPMLIENLSVQFNYVNGIVDIRHWNESDNSFSQNGFGNWLF
jgi:hypothetical protein